MCVRSCFSTTFNVKILNNELAEADVFCNHSLSLQTCELEHEEPIAHVENSRSEDMFSTVCFSELEEPFSHTQQFDIDDSTCSNSMFESFNASG